MKCLWLTLADPDPPINGQFLYSAGLIESLARAGAKLTVIGLGREPGAEGRRISNRVDMILAEDRPMPQWARFIRPAPMVAARCNVPGMQSAISSCLSDTTWEAVIFDSIAAGWAFPEVRRYCRRHSAKLVYLSHNYETGVARQLAPAARGWRRLAKEIDAWKVARLERRMIRTSDLVSANTPEDRQTMSRLAPENKPVVFLPPGYSGVPVASRLIGRSTPRRAVAVGSFDWLPKRISLEAFLEVGEPLLSRAGIELQIVGGAESSYLAGLRRRFPAVEFTGMVADVRNYMANARLAVVPDLLGGFKLKSLDYVFNRLPIFAMEGAVPGTPMIAGSSIRLFDSHKALAEGVIAAIDDLALLNAQQEKAFAVCADRFNWDKIGRTLLDTIRGIAPRKPGIEPMASGLRPGAIKVSPGAR